MNLKKALWLGMAALVLFVAAGPVWAQDPIAQLFPQASRMPAPSWIRPGLRLTYYSGAASLAGSSTFFWRDEKGGWVGQNPEDKGKRYQRGGQSGMGGHGYTQVDVVALEKGMAALQVVSWGMTPGSAALAPLGATALAAPAGAPGGWWVHPNALRNLKKAGLRGVTVTRFKKNFQGRPVPVLRIEYGKGRSRVVYSYDQASGVLLFTSSQAVSGEQAYTWAGERTAVSQSGYRGARVVNIPWAGGGAPAWLARFSNMSGNGRNTVSQPGVGAMPFPLQFNMRVINRGPRWVMFDLNTQVQSGAAGMPSQNSQAILMSGAAQMGGIWIPPGPLNSLRTGQVIDQDPFTKVRVRVAENSGQVFGLEESGGLHQVLYRYDKASGRLISVRRRVRVGMATQTTELFVQQVR
jgi:hypothetical protein